MNNYWEDKDMSEELKKVHNNEIDKMEMPSWAFFSCPFCGEDLDARALRSVSLCLNARNLGDVAVEFCCDKCSKMDTMYMREGIDTIHDFIDLLTEDTDPKSEPLLEEKMYSLQYNNLVERMHFHKEK